LHDIESRKEGGEGRKERAESGEQRTENRAEDHQFQFVIIVYTKTSARLPLLGIYT
jgi:hypothetical protein